MLKLHGKHLFQKRLLNEPLFYFEEEEKQQVRVASTTGGYVRPCFTAEEKYLLKASAPILLTS